MLMPPLGELLVAGLGSELNRLCVGTAPGLIAVLACAAGAFILVAIAGILADMGGTVRPWQREQS